ncbi:MAG: sulfite exporter TauE/SafE family protein [Candidatus Thermoplasmatota archaeon]|nr:sulfite exporter TauE/SafE family protein [Candidatus Thermoplasmatota archaeon]
MGTFPDLWIVIILVATLACFVQGLVGFGSGLIMVPILVLMIDPRVVVPATLMNGLVMNGVLAIEARRSIQSRRIAPILLGAVIGLPLGTFLLLILPGDILKVAIGSVIVIFGSILLSGISIRMKKEKVIGVPVGFISGVLNGSISMSGPPVILFFSDLGVKKANFRANLVTYFFLLNILTLIAFAVAGLIHEEVLVLFAVTLPASLVGIYVGTRVSKVVKEALFRKLALVLVIAAGLLSLAMGMIAIT